MRRSPPTSNVHLSDVGDPKKRLKITLANVLGFDFAVAPCTGEVRGAVLEVSVSIDTGLDVLIAQVKQLTEAVAAAGTYYMQRWP